MPPTLYKVLRTCCDCGIEAPAKKRGGPLGPVNMISIAPLIYRHGGNKGRQRTGATVNICEPCLVKSITMGRLSWLKGNIRLWTALQSSLTDCYNAHLLDDVKRPTE